MTDPLNRPCLCPNGHGQMVYIDAPDDPIQYYWKCATCQIERMWPDTKEGTADA